MSETTETAEAPDYEMLQDAFALVAKRLRDGDCRYRASVPIGDLDLLWCKDGGSWGFFVEAPGGLTTLASGSIVLRLEAVRRMSELVCAINTARTARTLNINQAVGTLSAIADRLLALQATRTEGAEDE